jgi:hypothetical protein
MGHYYELSVDWRRWLTLPKTNLVVPGRASINTSPMILDHHSQFAPDNVRLTVQFMRQMINNL